MAMKPKTHTYEGEQADVTWNGPLCIHVGECGRAKGDLFVGGRQPWCQPDLAATDDVAEVVERCPTGALTYVRKDGGASESPDAENTVLVANNGPLYLRGDLEIAGSPDDAPGLSFRAALCRCGKSENKPFCDNSHEHAEFVDRGAVGETGDGFEGTGGKLEVTRAPNGPLILNGKMAIITGSGRRAWQGEKAALCRCGASENKPFCDGSHKGIGFEAD